MNEYAWHEILALISDILTNSSPLLFWTQLTLNEANQFQFKWRL